MRQGNRLPRTSTQKSDQGKDSLLQIKVAVGVAGAIHSSSSPQPAAGSIPQPEHKLIKLLRAAEQALLLQPRRTNTKRLAEA
ncbi:hypothetical protein NC651_002025 [Populus alba x Populus x berolinensis]|nr:hypothetical protein NC651_002025 [Populus alba x Populus x berolinensis]